MRGFRTSGLQFLLALVLALALWTLVSFTTNPSITRQFPVPVQIILPSDGLLIVDPAAGEPTQPTVTTNLQVVGPQIDVNRLQDTANFTATADLSRFEPGLHSVPIEVSGPTGLRIRSRTPPNVTVRLVEKASRTYKLQSVVQGQLPFIFQPQTPTVATEQVVASGPPDLMARIDRVIVPIDMQTLTRAGSQQISLQAVDQAGNEVKGVELDPPYTRVSVPLEPRVDVQRVSVLPRFKGQPAAGYATERIDWNPKFVEVISNVVITGTLTTNEIDLTNRTRSFTQTVKLINPDRTSTQLLNDEITVDVPIVSFQLPQNYPLIVSVTPINLAPGLQAETQARSVTITVSGTFEKISQLATATPQAVVDLTGRGPGTYTLPVSIDLPPDLQIVGTQPQVTITISPGPSASPVPSGG